MEKVIFTVALVAGGDPIDLTPSAKVKLDGTVDLTAGWGVLDDASKAVVVIAYRDDGQQVNSLPFYVDWIVSGETTPDNLLEEGELAEITVYLHNGATAGMLTKNALETNTAFTLEVKPPTGSVIALNRTTPAALEPVMELR